jgi:hypothetical protein
MLIASEPRSLPRRPSAPRTGGSACGNPRERRSCQPLRERSARMALWGGGMALTVSNGSSVRMPGVHGQSDLPRSDPS